MSFLQTLKAFSHSLGSSFTPSFNQLLVLAARVQKGQTFPHPFHALREMRILMYPELISLPG